MDEVEREAARERQAEFDALFLSGEPLVITDERNKADQDAEAAAIVAREG